MLLELCCWLDCDWDNVDDGDVAQRCDQRVSSVERLGCCQGLELLQRATYHQPGVHCIAWSYNCCISFVAVMIWSISLKWAQQRQSNSINKRTIVTIQLQFTHQTRLNTKQQQTEQF